MLTGEYLKRAKANKLPREVRLLVTANYNFLRRLDDVMREPDSALRGGHIAQLSNALEMATDSFYLYGIKPPIIRTIHRKSNLGREK